VQPLPQLGQGVGVAADGNEGPVGRAIGEHDDLDLLQLRRIVVGGHRQVKAGLSGNPFHAGRKARAEPLAVRGDHQIAETLGLTARDMLAQGGDQGGAAFGVGVGAQDRDLVTQRVARRLLGEPADGDVEDQQQASTAVLRPAIPIVGRSLFRPAPA
jgi:hypothetical protein